MGWGLRGRLPYLPITCLSCLRSAKAAMGSDQGRGEREAGLQLEIRADSRLCHRRQARRRQLLLQQLLQLASGQKPINSHRALFRSLPASSPPSPPALASQYVRRIVISISAFSSCNGKMKQSRLSSINGSCIDGRGLFTTLARSLNI